MVKFLVAFSILLSVFLSTIGCAEVLGIHDLKKASIENCEPHSNDHQSDEHEAGSHCSAHCTHLTAISVRPVFMKLNELESKMGSFYFFIYSSPFIEAFKRPPLAG